jgi:hypothetical protein
MVVVIGDAACCRHHLLARLADEQLASRPAAALAGREAWLRGEDRPDHVTATAGRCQARSDQEVVK